MPRFDFAVSPLVDTYTLLTDWLLWIDEQLEHGFADDPAWMKLREEMLILADALLPLMNLQNSEFDLDSDG